jgi:hypothetical protein
MSTTVRKVAPSVDAEIECEFASTEDGRCYTLVVACAEGLSHDEYADCLTALAQDIREGRTDFAEASDAPSH